MLTYFFAAAILTAGVAPAASVDDIIAADRGPIAVHAFHHAALTLKWNGKLVLVDPASGVGSPANENPVKLFAGLKPDLILITHGHFDHFNVDVLAAVAGANATILAPSQVFDGMPPALKAKTKVMHNGDKTMAAGLPVEAVPAYNVTKERMQFHPKGAGNGYVLDLGGKRIYIAGDTEETPEIAHLANIDAAFIPMNLPYTQTVQEAAKWVKDFMPKRVYPYHFRGTDGSSADLSAFAAAVGKASKVKVLKWYGP
jgi:L-ascorbate metabolism protein UlaG (beta-lactamase superfamily)